MAIWYEYMAEIEQPFVMEHDDECFTQCRPKYVVDWNVGSQVPLVSKHYVDLRTPADVIVVGKCKSAISLTTMKLLRVFHTDLNALKITKGVSHHALRQSNLIPIVR